MQHRIVTFAGSLILLSAVAPAAETRPNIIVIMADDMGYSDLGCFGSEIQTPHLDRLATGGLRLSQFYNCALCGPSRAALMTGLYPHQVGITRWTGLLNGRCTTMFELFKQAGYATCAVGRLDMVTADNWHDPAMIGRYVDHFLGSTGHTGPGNYFKDVHNTRFFRNGEPFALPPEGTYKTDLITDFAVDFLTRAATDERPFLLYVAHYAPHWPLHAKPEDMAKYRALYRQLGWDAARQGRHERLLELGLIAPETQLAPRDQRAGAWDDAPHKDWEADRMAAYAGQIDALDQSVGRIMHALRQAKKIDNTLVLFFSDNGAADNAVKPVDRPGRTWRIDGVPTRTGNKPSIPPGRADTFVTAGPAWSNVSNAPFRHHKTSNHEGGIASPCIAWWPRAIKHPGTISHEPAHITDVLATCLDIADIDYPCQFKSRQIQPLVGQSLMARFQGKQSTQPRTLYWATSGNRALRNGPWKLVSKRSSPQVPDRWELYNLAQDRTELHDLSDQYPDRVHEMSIAFDRWQHAPVPSAP